MNAADILGKLLTSPVTLEKLAAAGKFASMPLMLPQDVCTVDWRILLDGELLSCYVVEVYAPGNETGWAVVYKDTEAGRIGEMELIYGNWELIRGPHDDDKPARKV